MRRKKLDFILFVLIFIYDRMTCEVNVGTHHLLQPFVTSIIKDRPSTTSDDKIAIHQSLLLSSNFLIKSNHLNLISSHHNSTIQPHDVIPIQNTSGINENKFNGASNSSKNIKISSQNKNKEQRTTQLSSSNNILSKRRSRRDVLLLYHVVSCGTGCNPMRLMGYGCYCGFMGAGIPVDGIDKCCQVHDWCYENVPCPAFMLYFLRYKWQCVNGTPQCYLQPNNCAYQMCQCDRMFAECLKQQPCPTKKVFCRSAPWRLIQNLIFDVGIAG